MLITKRFAYFRDSESDKKLVCYYCVPDVKNHTDQQDRQKYIVCFITEEQRNLDVYPYTVFRKKKCHSFYE